MQTSNYHLLIKQVESQGDRALAQGKTREGMEWYRLGLLKAKEAADKESAVKFTRLLALLF